MNKYKLSYYVHGLCSLLQSVSRDKEWIGLYFCPQMTVLVSLCHPSMNVNKYCKKNFTREVLFFFLVHNYHVTERKLSLKKKPGKKLNRNYS